MGVKSTQTITRADANQRYARLYVQTRADARREKRQRIIDDVGGIDSVDAAAYHRVDAKLREEKWRLDARVTVARASDTEMETLLERLNDAANGGEGFENYIISDGDDRD